MNGRLLAKQRRSCEQVDNNLQEVSAGEDKMFQPLN